MSDDPFSDILEFVQARTVVSGGFTAGGAWAIRFPAPEKIKFFGVVAGSCWLSIDDAPEPVRLDTGDVFLLAAQHSFVLARDLSIAPVASSHFFTPGSGAIVTVGDGNDCALIGGHVRLDPVRGGLLADVLPPLILVRAGSTQADVLRWLLDQLVREQAAELPGASLASAQLAQLLFVQVLRAHLDADSPLPAGWVRAVSDRRLAPALRLMHADPGRAWQLGELAKAAAMSRTAFAVHFKAVAGIAPLMYLTTWRMRLAERALRESNASMSTLAGSLGYGSESAFSNAFKRVTGTAPAVYRRTIRATVAEHR